jgi:hypothetical protein
MDYDSAYRSIKINCPSWTTSFNASICENLRGLEVIGQVKPVVVIDAGSWLTWIQQALFLPLPFLLHPPSLVGFIRP